jgi:hypothetical protein
MTFQSVGEWPESTLILLKSAKMWPVAPSGARCEATTGNQQLAIFNRQLTTDNFFSLFPDFDGPEWPKWPTGAFLASAEAYFTPAGCIRNYPLTGCSVRIMAEKRSRPPHGVKDLRKQWWASFVPFCGTLGQRHSSNPPISPRPAPCTHGDERGAGVRSCRERVHKPGLLGTLITANKH